MLFYILYINTMLYNLSNPSLPLIKQMFMQHQLCTTAVLMVTSFSFCSQALVCLVTYFYDNPVRVTREGVVPIFAGEQISSKFKWFSQGQISWSQDSLCLIYMLLQQTTYLRLTPFDISNSFFSTFKWSWSWFDVLFCLSHMKQKPCLYFFLVLSTQGAVW